MFDIAVNLADAQLRPDADGVLERAQSAGVNACLLIGCDLEESQWLAQNYERFGQPWTAGIHPHHAKHASPDAINHLRQLQQLPGCVAVGECGLDYFRMLSPEQIQLDCCEAQIDLAIELDKPAYLHDRDASDALIEMIRGKPNLRGVVHCFTGDRRALESYLDLGLSIGITGWCLDERRGQALAELVPDIPTDRLLLETDAPYLVPRTIRPRPKRNEPAFLGTIAQGVAALRGESPEDIQRQTSQNAAALFQC